MKIPAEFAPKSWEMPQGARVIEASVYVVARDFDGETLNWLVALVEWPNRIHVMWLRPLDARFDAGFIVTSPESYSSHDIMIFSEKMERGSLVGSLNTVWKNGQFARKFFLNKDRNLLGENEIAEESLTVGCNGIATWSLLGTNKKDEEYWQHFWPYFKWDLAKTNVEFLHLPAAKLWEKFQKLLADTKSDAMFVRCFASLSAEERSALLFGETRGTDQELASLVRVRLHLQDSQNLWDNGFPSFTFFMKADVNGSRLYWCHPFRHTNDFPQGLAEDIDQLFNHFRSMNGELLNINCVADWARTTEHFQQRISPPTAHEQLEAHLLWRDWRERLQSEKI